MTLLDHFLCKKSYVKWQVYKNNSQSIPALQGEISRVIADLELQLCQNVVGHFNKRVGIRRVARESFVRYRFSSTYTKTNTSVKN